MTLDGEPYLLDVSAVGAGHWVVGARPISFWRAGMSTPFGGAVSSFPIRSWSIEMRGLPVLDTLGILRNEDYNGGRAMSNDSAVTLRAYVPPVVTDYGSIAHHTFNRPPGVCEGNGGNNTPTDVFTKLCGLEHAGGVSP